MKHIRSTGAETKEDYENGALSAVTVLSELGGFDLAGMTGLF